MAIKARPKEYIKTDRNGTKYYTDWTCPKCGGTGTDSAWSRTGYTCWKCNGTGEIAPRITKEYTPEYRAILEEKKRQKVLKERAERIEELRSDMSKAYREVGFGDDGHLYIVTEGNTYDRKEELKADGARWYPNFRRWGFKARPEKWQTLEIRFEDFYEINEYGVVVIKGFGVTILEEMELK